MANGGQATRLDRLLILLETGAPAARKAASEQIGDLALEGGQSSVHALVFRWLLTNMSFIIFFA